MKRIISIALALIMLSMTLLCVSCSDENNGDKTNNDNGQISTDDAGEKGLYYTAGEAEIDKYNLNGYEFNIFARNIAEGAEFSVTDVVVGDDYDSSNAVDSAVYQRQLDLENKFGFTMKLDLSSYTSRDDGKEIEIQVQSGICEYDIAFPMASKAAVMATAGQLYDLNTLEHFDVDSGAWSKMFCDNLEWNGKLCFAVGGISVTNAYNSIRCLMFNKDLASKYGYSDIYQTVFDGNWTLEKMNAMATAVADDLNGDGKMDITDQWGMTWQSAMSGEVFFYGCDELIVKNNAQGTPELSLGNSRSYDVYETIQMMISNPNVYYMGVDSDIRKMFTDGNTLFFTEVINLLPLFRNTEHDFGLLPLPKFDEEQENYVQYVDEWCPSPVVVPITVQNPDRCGFLIQLLAETGMERIKPEYYDRTLSYMLVRDLESHEILEIITNNFVLDSAVLYDWASFRLQFRNGFSNGTGLSSLLATYTTQISNAITKTGEAYDQNVK